MDNSKTTKTVGSIVTKLAHVVNADKALNTPKGPLRGGCRSYLKFVIYIFIIIILVEGIPCHVLFLKWFIITICKRWNGRVLKNSFISNSKSL